MTDVPVTTRGVATRDSANQAAVAFSMLARRRRRLWGFYLAVELALALVLALSFDARFGPATRLFWGCVYALVPTLVLAVLSIGIGLLLNRRFFRRRLREGAVLEAGIGERDRAFSPQAPLTDFLVGSRSGPHYAPDGVLARG